MTTVKGYFSAHGKKPQPCEVSIALDGYGLHERLTADCRGAYRVVFPYRPAEKLAGELRRKMRDEPGEYELSVTLEADDGHLHSGSATVWLRGNISFEMLTVELGGMGQISVPYSTVEALVRLERGKRA